MIQVVGDLWYLKEWPGY